MGPETNTPQPNRRTGRGLAWLAIIALIGGLTALYEAMSGRGGDMMVMTGANGQARVILERERSGHFMAEGAINGEPVRFLVDTGATDVAISQRTARELGLPFGPRIAVMTAAGPAPAWGTRIARVSLGGLSLDDVRATITPGLGRQALLGMSFLKHFNLRQEGDHLIIETGGGAWDGAETG